MGLVARRLRGIRTRALLVRMSGEMRAKRGSMNGGLSLISEGGEEPWNRHDCRFGTRLHTFILSS